MKIDFTPSVKTVATMQRIAELKESMTWEQVAKEIGYSRRYCVALNSKYKEMLAIANKLSTYSKGGQV